MRLLEGACDPASQRRACARADESSCSPSTPGNARSSARHCGGNAGMTPANSSTTSILPRSAVRTRPHQWPCRAIPGGQAAQGFYEARLTDELRVCRRRPDGQPAVHRVQGPLVRWSSRVIRCLRIAAMTRSGSSRGSADEDLLEDSTIRIEEFFRAQGYRDAAAPHRREERRRTAPDLRCEEGAQYRVESVDIVGNSTVSVKRSCEVPCRAASRFRGDADADLAADRRVYRRLGFRRRTR
jgi:hypothetical protein